MWQEILFFESIHGCKTSVNKIVYFNFLLKSDQLHISTCELWLFSTAVYFHGTDLLFNIPFRKIFKEKWYKEIKERDFCNVLQSLFIPDDKSDTNKNTNKSNEYSYSFHSAILRTENSSRACLNKIPFTD